MFERVKYCPVCGEVSAVLDGNPDKYGDKAMGWNRFIATKYDCAECRKLMKSQSTRLSGKRTRAQWREQRRTVFDALDLYRDEIKLSKERVALLERENRAARQRIAELEARL